MIKAIILLMIIINAHCVEYNMYLVRHCEPAEGGFGLSANGKQDAKSVGMIFVGRKISKIYSSPHERTRETAEAIAKEIGYTGKIILVNDLNQDEKEDKWVPYLRGKTYTDEGQNAIFVTHFPNITKFRDSIGQNSISVGYGTVLQVGAKGITDPIIMNVLKK